MLGYPARRISSRLIVVKSRRRRVQTSATRSLVDIVAKCTSQTRAVLSSTDAVTMRVPSGLKAAEVTAELLGPSCQGTTAISLPVATSQMRAVPSADAVTMRVPSKLKAAEFTYLSCPRRTAVSLPVCASKMRAGVTPDTMTVAVPPRTCDTGTETFPTEETDDAVTTRVPSGLKPAKVTVSSPPSLAMAFPVAASQRLTCGNPSDAVTMGFPSGLKTAEYMSVKVMPMSRMCSPVVTSQMRAKPTCVIPYLSVTTDAVTIRMPSGLKAADRTAPLFPPKTAICFISSAVEAAQIRTVVSDDHVRICPPSGLKAADRTEASCPRSTATCWPVTASQMRAVLSSDAVTRRVPSGLKMAEVTPFSCPRRTAISLPVAASQMRAVLSAEAVTMRVPSGLNAGEVTPSLCPLNVNRNSKCETAAASKVRGGPPCKSGKCVLAVNGRQYRSATGCAKPTLRDKKELEDQPRRNAVRQIRA